MRRKITVVKGNDKVFTVRVTKDGNPLDLTHVEIHCEVKDKPDGQLLFSAIVTKTDPAQGTFVVKFPKSETQKLNINQRIYFDFLLVFIDGTEKNLPTPPYEAVVVGRVTD